MILIFSMAVPSSVFAVDWDRIGQGLNQLKNGGLQGLVAVGLGGVAAINAVAPDPTFVTKAIAIGAAAGSSYAAGNAGHNIGNGIRNLWGGIHSGGGPSPPPTSNSGSQVTCSLCGESHSYYDTHHCR